MVPRKKSPSTFGSYVAYANNLLQAVTHLNVVFTLVVMGKQAISPCGLGWCFRRDGASCHECSGLCNSKGLRMPPFLLLITFNSSKLKATPWNQNENLENHKTKRNLNHKTKSNHHPRGNPIHFEALRRQELACMPSQKAFFVPSEGAKATDPAWGLGIQ